MSLTDYIRRKYAPGGEVEEELEPTTTETTNTTVVVNPSQGKSKQSPLTAQNNALASNPDIARARDERARAFYQKQLDDIAQKEGSLFEQFGLNDVLSRTGYSPRMQKMMHDARQKELADRMTTKAGATAGLADLDAQQAVQSQRRAVTQLLADPTPENIQKARALDPEYTRSVVNTAQSTYGKQAQDLGFVPGSAEFNQFVQRQIDADIEGKQAKAQAQVTKPLSTTEQKAVNDLASQSTNANNDIQELQGLLQGVKSASELEVGKLGSLYSWTGFGKAADIEAQLAKLAPRQRPPGAGATSDYDAKQYLKAVGGGLGKENLQRRINAAIAMKQRESEHALFLAQVKESRGSTADATRLWNQYAKENSIFDEKGNIRENVPSFEQWRSGEKVGVPAPTEKNQTKTTEKKQASTSSGGFPPKGTTKTIGETTYVFDGVGWKVQTG